MTLTKDMASGIIFMLAGLLFVVEAQSHPMGSLLRMGPGFYPTLIGGLNTLVGAALIGKSLFRQGVPVPPIAWRELTLLTGGILVTAFALERLGLIFSTLLLVIISRLVSRPVHWVGTLVLAGVLSLVGTAIFWWFLKLPIPLWP